MTDPDQERLEELLRSALHERAANVHPAGDGLQRVRERVQQRRRRLTWLRPTLAAVAAAAAVGAVFAVPATVRLLEDDGAEQITVASDGTESPESTAPPPSASPSPTSPPGREPSSAPPSGSPADTGTTAPEALPDIPTVWPYASREEGLLRADKDVAANVHPMLRDPRRTAVAFVESYVGPTELVADSGVALERGIGITLYREEPDGVRTPVSLVYLVRVREGDDSPYVVANAQSVQNGLVVSAGEVEGTEELPVQVGLSVAGAPPTVPRPGGIEDSSPARSIKVELREPGKDRTVAANSIDPDQPSDDTAGKESWSVALTPAHRLQSPGGTVAAWTVDESNRVISFVAVPVPVE